MKKIIALLGLLVVLFSCEEILFEPELKDENIEIVAPQNKATLFSTNVNFSWQQINGASNYQIQIARPDFDNSANILVDEELEETDFDRVLEEGNYQWRVRALADIQKSPYTTASFSVSENPDFTKREVVLLSPENNSFSNTKGNLLKWNAVRDAENYMVETLDENNIVLETTTTEETSITIDFPEGTTSWRVRAEKEEEKTAFFTAILNVDTQKPNIPELQLPANAANLPVGAVTFTWEREAINGTTETDSLYIFRDANLSTLETKLEADSPAEVTLERNTYFWRIQSFDEAGNESTVSNTFSFTLN